jgi:hypothetical protein
MADRTIKVLTPATVFDILTLAEAKLLLGMSTTDTSQDAVLTMWITTFSMMMATYCNRTFAKETVMETWRETFDGRLFLSHWPIKAGDVESVSDGSAPVDPSAYELEEKSGKLSFVVNPGGSVSMPWLTPTVVTYSGGYDLPTEAPPDLKQAAAILIRDEQIRTRQAQVAGIRSISHKDSRVMFFDPNAILIKMAGLKMTPGFAVVDTLLRHYIRFEV